MPFTPRSSGLDRLLRVLGLLSICALPVVAVPQAQAPDSSRASIQIEAAQDHFHGGSDLIFRMKLNEALPEGARFDVRLSPVGVDQELTVSSGEPANKERTEFILKTKLPDKAVPGEWHIKVVWLFLSGASWTNNTLATNADFKFLVDGPRIEIPTRATASLVSDHR
jgi:hypothetical protein